MAKTVTMDEIAAKAGVSRGTVSMALRGNSKISVKTTDKVLSIAKAMGYRPNLNASRLAQADYKTFGLLTSDLHNPIMADILDGFVLAGEQQGFETYLASAFNSVERERSMVESFLSHRVKGIVVIGSLLPASEIIALADLVPVVVVGRNIQGVDSVLVDDEVGGRLAADHLLSLGHRNLAHIDGGEGAGAVRRKNSFLSSAENAGATVKVAAGNYTQEGGYRAAQVLLAKPDRPSAIFAGNDLSALGVLGAAREQGLMVGQDLALVGFDDITIAAYDYVSLTTVSYSRNEMGSIARELLLERCSASDAPKRTIELKPTLVERKTSRAA